jgi:hypothetical protein
MHTISNSSIHRYGSFKSCFFVSPYSRRAPVRKWFGVESTLRLIKARRTLDSVCISHSHLLYTDVTRGKVIDSPAAFNTVLKVQCQRYGQPAGPLLTSNSARSLYDSKPHTCKRISPYCFASLTQRQRRN